MDLIRDFLVAMHPSDWRQRYGEEFRALLEDTRLTPTSVVDVLRNCLGVQARIHRRGLAVAVAVLVSVSCEFAARRAGLSANILWAPTNLLRALALLGTVGPWAGLTVTVMIHRRAATRA